ncbi:MAG: 2-succinyl-5-enolpyruvyl-6-hydroxy-3-cyclohexene-1-carboxylic-acid synthase [Bdellovibrionales bacterium]|nr:2-succinyl-5-enolpyruvyl-6-hydroxy-3-cyclohexene-1-carboxylic-acid synthase [Bdellovibrionales bacterium]
MDGLVASGVRHFFTSPGFRNSPILAVLAGRPGVVSHIDERGAAFAALGAAKATGSPVAVICTSGTAVGNLLPAVMEAFHSRVPLVAVSADRPSELIGVGANQATWQPGIFGRFAESVDLSVPDRAAEARQWGDRAAVAVNMAKSARFPIHLNARFREPFTFTAMEMEERSALFAAPEPARELPTDGGGISPDLSRAVVLLGDGVKKEERQWLCRFCREKNVPLLSNTYVAADLEAEILRADLFLRSESIRRSLRAKTVIRVGAPLIGRSYSALWKGADHRVVVDEEGRDPDLTVKSVYRGGVRDFLGQRNSSADPAWRDAWIEAESFAEKAVEDGLRREPALTEWRVWRDLSWIPAEADLFVGNSMPIRDFLWVGLGRRGALTNRGLSGIDGLISTAIGASLGSGKRIVAVLGDLSTIHDTSALTLGRNTKAPVVLVVLNNGGGEIFRVVEAAEYPVDEAVFTTPNQVDFVGLATAFGWSAVKVQSMDGLREAVAAATGPALVEVSIDRERSTALRRAVWESLR